MKSTLLSILLLAFAVPVLAQTAVIGLATTGGGAATSVVMTSGSLLSSGGVTKLSSTGNTNLYVGGSTVPTVQITPNEYIVQDRFVLANKQSLPSASTVDLATPTGIVVISGTGTVQNITFGGSSPSDGTVLLIVANGAFTCSAGGNIFTTFTAVPAALYVAVYYQSVGWFINGKGI